MKSKDYIVLPLSVTKWKSWEKIKVYSEVDALLYLAIQNELKTSIRQLAMKFNWSQTKVVRFIEKCKNDNIIVCDFDKNKCKEGTFIKWNTQLTDNERVTRGAWNTPEKKRNTQSVENEENKRGAWNTSPENSENSPKKEGDFDSFGTVSQNFWNTQHSENEEVRGGAWNTQSKFLEHSKDNEENDKEKTKESNTKKIIKEKEKEEKEKGDRDLFNNKSLSTCVDVAVETEEDLGIDFKGLVKYFNDQVKKHNSLLPPIRAIDNNRKKMVRARVKEFGKESLAEVIKKAVSSPFLNGKNDRGFIASFDWFIRPNNFVKVLEGNYNQENYGNSRTNSAEGRKAGALAVLQQLASENKPIM